MEENSTTIIWMVAVSATAAITVGKQMADELKLNRAKERGAQAEMLLRNEMLAEAFKQLESQYLAAWGATHAHEVETRENLWRATQILGDVRRHLIKVVNDSTVQQALRISSPQAGTVYSGGGAKNDPKADKDRFLEVEMFTSPPMTAVTRARKSADVTGP